jgi:sigma-B regulation protein RsbU (phosphoserine phosphatase)
LLQAGAAGFATPILFISGDGDTSTKVQAFENGGVDYITKPLAGAEVIARVRTHLRLKQACARVAELQIEHVQRLASVQQNLMPRPADLPEARFQVSIRQVLTAGGDFYDVIPAGPDIVDYLIADSSGHDLAASFWTAALKALAAEYASPLNLPLEVVFAINSALCRVLPSGSFFTLVYARLNHQTGSLFLVNAGHPPAIVIHADNSEPVVIEQEGDVVGAFPEVVYGTKQLTLRKGDRVFFYTDGLIELGDSREEAIERLVRACSSRKSMPLSELIPAVVDDVMNGRPAADDMLLMGVER